MGFCSVHRGCVLALAGAVCLAAPLVDAQTATYSTASHPTIFSDPSDSSVLTNIMDAKMTGTVLENQDDQMNRDYNTLKPAIHGDSFEGPMVVNVPQPVINSQKARDLLDKSKNWMFLTPEDYNDHRTVEEAIGATASNQESSRKTAFERFSERGMNNSTGTTNSARSKSDDDDEDSFFSKGNHKPAETDAFNQAARLSRLDPTSDAFSDPNSTWGFNAFSDKSADRNKDLEKLREQSQSPAERKDLFQRLQSGPDLTPSATGSPSQWGSMSDVQNLTSGNGDQQPPMNLPDTSPISAAPDASMGIQPMAAGVNSGAMGLPDATVAPSPSSTLSPNASGQPDLSRFAMPQPIFQMPKRKL